MKKGEKKKLQKALARRTASKVEKRQQRDLQQQARPRHIVSEAHSYPLLGCWVTPDWQERGLGVVIIARQQPNGMVVFGSFLVDVFCLGIKDAFYNANIPLSTFKTEVLPDVVKGGRPEPIDADLAHQIIYGGMEYAARWGFQPHSDFETARGVLDPPEAHPLTGLVTFGKDGKPFYIQGTHDNTRAILRQLERTAGPGNYDFITEVPGF